ncbi:MAG: hypothetical protein HY551_04745 [Elusimicrobia bacterium]|nr:hypothetical protein [Elusimicrobiota bacterium]
MILSGPIKSLVDGFLRMDPRRRAGLLSATAGLALLTLYWSWPDAVYTFDGIIFSGVIERSIDDWRLEFFNRRHLLFNPAMMGVREALLWAGLPLSGYEVLQRVNGVLGVAGAAIFFFLVLRLTGLYGLSGLAAAGLALSNSYWCRATEGQVYMAMTCGAIATAWSAIYFIEKPNLYRGAALAFTAALAILFHAANAAMLPAVACAVGLGCRRARSWKPSAALVLLALGILAPFAIAFKIRDAQSLLQFLVEATGFYNPSGHYSLPGLAEHFFKSGTASGSAGGRALQVFSLLISGWIALPESGLNTALGFLFATGLLGVLWFAGRKKTAAYWDVAAVLAAWALGTLALEFFWRGGPYFMASPVAAALALAALAARDWLVSKGPLQRRATAAVLFCVVAATGAWNWRASIRPRSLLRNNIDHGRALFVREHTVPSSWVVLSGMAYTTNMKVYLPYFAGRPREALEFYFNSGPKEAGLQKLARFMQWNIQHGIPLYFLSDLVDDAESWARIKENWGLSREQIWGCLGSGQFYRVASRETGFQLFLFIPESHPERLFSSLGYSVLMETDMRRLQETAGVLKQIAHSMAPARRRATLEVMRRSNYGILLLRDGFWGFMSPESRRAAEERVRRFEEWKKSPLFHLRLGNLYQYLGLTEEVRREWAEAYRMTRDPALAQDIANLK